MNNIKEQGQQLAALINKVNEFNTNAGGVDSDARAAALAAEPFRWAAIAKSDFQTGLMALTRAVAKPEFF